MTEDRVQMAEVRSQIIEVGSRTRLRSSSYAAARCGLRRAPLDKLWARSSLTAGESESEESKIHGVKAEVGF